MKRNAILVAVAALSFMLTACGEKKADKAQADENQKESTVQEQTVADDENAIADEEFMGDGELEDDGVAPGDCEIPAIRKAWAKREISPVAADKGADITHLAYAFCTEYAKYLPNKSLAEYLEFPDRYNEEEADYRVEDQTKKGYLSCFMNRDLDWGVDCCYWNRSNGHQLVAFWLMEDHVSWDKYENLLVFYDYDPDTDTMKPEPALAEKMEKEMGAYDSYSFSLPADGKDIAVLCHNTLTNHDFSEEVHFLYRWNGNDFKLEKVKEIRY